MKKVITALHIFLIVSVYYSNAQLLVDASMTPYPQMLVENYLVGDGVTVISAHSNNTFIELYRASIGYFDGSMTNLGLDNGIILSTGIIYDALGPNDVPHAGDSLSKPGDNDLDQISDFATYDAIYLSFYFYPKFRNLSFEYVFASEEYEEYVCSPYNDVFGFFISGPGITGKKNIARVPVTDEYVTINTIQNGCYDPYKNRCVQWQCDKRNEELFILNREHSHQYDGFTKVLPAYIEGLQPNRQYMIKIVIADVSDQFYDAAVFLKGGSFRSIQKIYSQNVCFGEEVNFSCDYRGDVKKYTWDFGDGNTSNEAEPSHLYDAPGIYDVNVMIEYLDALEDDTLYAKVYVYEPEADFSWEMGDGDRYEVDFTDKSSDNLGKIESWKWDFGDGITSTKQSPSHDFKQMGQFYVTLIIETREGCRDTITRLIKNYDTPVIYEGVCAGEPFEFSTKNSGIVSKFFWDFGDGNTSEEDEPTHIYDSSGTYYLTLYLKYMNNSYDTLTFPIQVYGANANFTYAIGGGPEPDVQFTDISTSEYSVISEWQWDFGDGTGSSEQHPLHKYTKKSAFNVTLITTTTEGCKDTINKYMTTYANDMDYTAACAGEEVPFHIVSTWDTVSCQWNFGDNTTSSENNPVHIYDYAGNYTVTVIVKNSGTEDLDTVTAQIIVSKAEALFSYTNGPGSNPLIKFTDASTVQNGSVAEWNWDFGDGNSSQAVNPRHQYDSAGTYTVTLEIVSDNGCTDTMQVIISITDIANQLAYSGECAGEEFQFAVETNWEQVDYNWDFGDGGTSSINNPTHVYDNAGDYNLVLHLINTNTYETDSIGTIISVSDIHAAYSFDVGGGTNPTVYFTNETTVENGSLYQYYWDFGDGASSNEENPEHQYDEKTMYDVMLIAVSENGCRDTIIREVNSVVNSILLEKACVNTSVLFEYQTAWNISSVSWDFGDGTSSNEENPEHTYTKGGEYDIELIVNNADRDETDTIPKTIYISEPFADFNYDLTVQDSPLLELFDISTVINGVAAEWDWDFGDGNTSNEQNPVHQYNFAKAVDVILIMTTDIGCKDTVQKRIRLYGTSNAVVKLPDTCVYIGDEFTVPLLLSTSYNLDNSENFNYKATVSFNRTVLLPNDNSLKYDFTDNYCNVHLSGQREPGNHILDYLPLVALLGNDDTVSLSIDSFEWTDGEETPTDIINGSVCILDLCQAGGTRLYLEGGKVSINSVTPNPALNDVDIIYEVVADGYTELFITDYLGHRIKTLVDEELEPGQYKITLGLNDFASGTYLITLRTLSTISTKRMEVIK